MEEHGPLKCFALSGFSLTQLQKKWPHYPIKKAIALSSPAPLLHLCAAWSKGIALLRLEQNLSGFRGVFLLFPNLVVVIRQHPLKISRSLHRQFRSLHVSTRYRLFGGGEPRGFTEREALHVRVFLCRACHSHFPHTVTMQEIQFHYFPPSSSDVYA